MLTISEYSQCVNPVKCTVFGVFIQIQGTIRKTKDLGLEYLLQTIFPLKRLPGFHMYLPEKEWNTASWFPSSYRKGLGEATSAVPFTEALKLCELASVSLVAISLSSVHREISRLHVLKTC